MREFKKQYDYAATNGSKVKVSIDVEIENLNKTDLREILSIFAEKTRDFYLDMGNKISNMP